MTSNRMTKVKTDADELKSVSQQALGLAGSSDKGIAANNVANKPYTMNDWLGNGTVKNKNVNTAADSVIDSDNTQNNNSAAAVKDISAKGNSGSATSSANNGTNNNSELFENYLSPLNDKYGGSLVDYDASGLEGYELQKYQNDRDAFDVYEILNKNYMTSQEQARDNMYEQLRDAYVSTELSKKYLTEQLARSGWDTNIGLTTSAASDINTQYANSRADAQREYNSHMRELLNDTQSQLLETESARRNANSELDIQEIEEKRAAAYNEIGNMITNYLSGDKTYSLKEIAQNINENQYLDAEQKEKLAKIVGLNFENDEYKDPAPDFATQNKYGIVDPYAGIVLDTAGAESFGKYNGTGKGTQQDQYINKIIGKAKEGAIDNGTVINMNYGAGKADNYVYYNGRFYKTTNKATIDSDNVDKNWSEQSVDNDNGNPSYTQQIFNSLSEGETKNVGGFAWKRKNGKLYVYARGGWHEAKV
ncbi:MAG: hypothetical protein ACLTEK_01125 [Christensenellales bacterium]